MNLSYDERGAEGTVVAITEKARKAITSGVYAGLGIGIQNATVDADHTAPGGRITDGRVIQVSLLDHPMIYRDPRPSPVVRRVVEVPHKWRAWPVTSFSVDVICIGCGESQQWPMKCYLEAIHVPPVELSDPTSELAALVEGAWIGDALPCGFHVTARTAERCLASCLQHMASCHNG
jgi:hypothetical protein